MREVMTPMPVTIQSDFTVADAAQVMYDKDIRHLPVVDGNVVVGILTQRDLILLEGVPDLHADGLPIHQVMTKPAFTCAPDDPLDQVAGEMYEKKIGSAIVVEEGQPIGIFTTTDALKVIVDLLGR